MNQIIQLWNDRKDPNLNPISGGFVETEFNPSLNQPATLSWGGGYEWLSVKYDNWVDLIYVARLSELWFEGMQGTSDISHFRLWNPTSVPDASVMLLLGSSFLGFAIYGRKRKES